MQTADASEKSAFNHIKQTSGKHDLKLIMILHWTQNIPEFSSL
jgi:hypothetical protein